MSMYKFPCGCTFPILKYDEYNNPRILFIPKLENINLDCERTWDLISSGNTLGVFQLESRLGQSLARKLKPRNIEHLAALISIIRPGCLEAIRDKKSVTMHYIDRKNGEEPIEYFHEALKSSLGKTYGEMIYQEQAMQIARDIAGFDLQRADELRKAIGKKKPELMAKMKIAFLEGAKAQGILTEEQAQDLFGWIEKSQRYSFNKSHAVSYACNAYLSAFAKAHFARAFFTSYLRYSKEKQRPFDEIHELIQNARLMAIDVNGPDIRYLYKHFKLVDKKIFFGFFDIKGIGESVWKKIIHHIDRVQKILGPIANWSWLEFLVHFSQSINSTAVVAMINSGALSYMGVSRTRMAYEYNLYDKLTGKERAWIENYVLLPSNGKLQLQDVLMTLTATATGKSGACANEKRRSAINSFLKTLINPSYNLNDAPEWMASVEESLLGIPLTCTSIDACDTSAANCTCLEYVQGSHPKLILVAAKIDSVNEIKTKTGKNPGQKMAFLKISDISGSIDNVVIFPDVWDEARKIVFLGNNILVHGERNKDKDSFIVKQIWQL